MPPGCDPSQTQGWAPTYDLVGLEPLSEVVDQETTQITVRFTADGLYAIVLSPQDLSLGATKNVIFVDESGAPIAHCDAVGVCQHD